MPVICLILFLGVAILWFLSNEYPAVFGVFLPTCAVRRLTFKIIVSATFVAAVFLSGRYGDSGRFFTICSPGVFDCQSMIAVVLSALIMLLVLKVSGIRGSAVFALIGGFEACIIATIGEAEGFPFLSLLAAPVAAMLVSGTLSFLLRWIFGKCRIHLLTLSYYMRFAVIVSLILTAFALGINYGGFIIGGASAVLGNTCPAVIVTSVLAVAIVLMSPFMRDMSDENAGEYSDFSIYTVLSVGVSTALVLLFFSFDATVGLVSLKAAPLSVSSLVYASVAGAEISGKRNMIEPELHIKELAAMLLAPAGSLVITYVILYLTGNSDDVVDFTVMSAAVIVLVALVFAVYASRQRRQKEMTDRLVYSQQQQIYENSRALKDMQLKVVMSENQALHNAVEMKRQEVMNVALSIMEQKEYLESLNDIVNRLSKSKDEKERVDLINELGTSLKQRLSYDRDVDTAYFYAQAESLHEDFSAKLAENFPGLTQQEKRLATLLRLGFSSKYIATLMNITVKSVEISRYRLRQKLGLSKGDNLVNFIKSI